METVTRTTHEPPHNRTHERNTRPNHLAATGGCATTVRATSHAWMGGRAEGARRDVRGGFTTKGNLIFHINIVLRRRVIRVDK